MSDLLALLGCPTLGFQKCELSCKKWVKLAHKSIEQKFSGILDVHRTGRKQSEAADPQEERQRDGDVGLMI